jgi:hypothetical protein
VGPASLDRDGHPPRPLHPLTLGHYIPLTWLSFAIDYVLWCMNPAGYNLTSVGLHAVAVPLFYGVAARLLRNATTLTGPALYLAAASAALFFAVHPLRVESVAWVTERRDVLSAVFLFITVGLYLRACEAQGSPRRRLLAGAVVAYGCALAAKSIVMTFPAVMVLLNVYPLRRGAAGAATGPGRAAGRCWRRRHPSSC